MTPLKPLLVHHGHGIGFASGTVGSVVPLLHDKEVIGALWLDSEKLASFKPKDLELPRCQ